MNFRDLEYVLEVSRTLSFSKAAEICNVSQPSLSAQIKKLELELGSDLFIRNNRKTYLTAFGASFIEKAEEILAIQSDIRQLARQNKDPLEGEFRLGAILTVAPYLFPNLARKVRDKAPKIDLSLREGKTEELLSALLAGRIDAALISLPTDENVFETYALFQERFFVAVSNENPLAKKENVRLQDLKNEQLILLEEGHCFRTQALEVCQFSHAQESSVFKATSLETIRNFVAAGNGMTLIPEMAMQDTDGVTYLPIEDKIFTREIGLVWRKSCDKKSKIERFIEMITPLSL